VKEQKTNNLDGEEQRVSSSAWSQRKARPAYRGLYLDEKRTRKRREERGQQKFEKSWDEILHPSRDFDSPFPPFPLVSVVA